MRYEVRLRRLEARHPPPPAWTRMQALWEAYTAAIRAKLARRPDGIPDTPEQTKHGHDVLYSGGEFRRLAKAPLHC